MIIQFDLSSKNLFAVSTSFQYLYCKNTCIMKHFLGYDNLSIFWSFIASNSQTQSESSLMKMFFLYFEYVKCKERRVVDIMHPR